MCPPFQVQYGSSKLPEKFYTGEVDAFWRSDTSFEESRQHYLEERDKLRKAQASKTGPAAPVGNKGKGKATAMSTA